MTKSKRLAALVIVAMMGVVVNQVPSLADSVRDRQWHLVFLDVARAHQINQGEGVLVAVADTGVDATHPDLAGAINSGIEIGESGDGRRDTDGHGTAMAGIIAGRGRGPNVGILGIAPKTTVVPIRTLPGGDFGGNPAHLGQGIVWAVEHGARVICIAAGTSPDPAVFAGVQAAIRADVVVIAGAGNRPEDSNVGYPARLPGVLAVGGVDRDGHHAAISVSGPEVAISAPAVDITSTGAFGTYRTATGTSDATAIVAGAAALVRSKYPNLSAPEVIHRLTATATDKGPPGRDDQYGYGVLNLVEALTADVPPIPSASPPPQASQPTGNLGLVAIIAIVALVAGSTMIILLHRRPS